MKNFISGASGATQAGVAQKILVDLGRLVGDRGNRGKADNGMSVAVHLLDPQTGQPVGNLGFDLAPEQLVDQVLRRQLMTHHSKSQLDRLEPFFLRPQLACLMLEPP